jgi:hypothetical protein
VIPNLFSGTWKEKQTSEFGIVVVIANRDAVGQHLTIMAVGKPL